jgi:ribosomal protein S18 acetylase RimI-like enzyme
MTIRHYRDHDKADVLALWELTGLLVSGSNYERDIRTKMSFQSEFFFVGTSEENIVGSIMVGYDGRRGWLNCLAVHPKFQRHGLGKQLVDFGISELEKLGCQKVNVQVRTSNLDVLAFYQKLGFSDDHVIGLGKKIGRDRF